MKPYTDNLEHLLDELSRIDLVIKSYLHEIRGDIPKVADEFMGLYVSEAEIERIKKIPSFKSGKEKLQDIKIERLKEINAIRKEIDFRIAETLKEDKELRLQKLAVLFSLDTFEIDILLIGLAPELDLKYEKLYSYLQNDITKKKPTIDLILNLFFPTVEEKIKSRAYFSSAASLIKNNLVHLLGREVNQDSSLISSFIKVDEKIINFLLGFGELDPKIRDISYLIKPAKAFKELILPIEFKNELTNTVNWCNENKFPGRFLFYGPSGSGKKSVAEIVCKKEGINLLVIDSSNFLLLERSVDVIYVIIREALLQNSAIYFQDFDMLSEDKTTKNFPQSLIKILKDFPGWVFLSGKNILEFDGSLVNKDFIQFSFPIPSYPIRKKLWEFSLKNYELDKKVDLDALASKFRFTGGQIENASLTAFYLSGEGNSINHMSSPILSKENLYKACKSQSNHKLNSLAQKINPNYTWEDIVLPKDVLKHLKEVSGFVKYKGKVYSDWGFEKKLSLGKGLNILFSGPPGTGKTMAAEILANELKLDFYKIDLSSIVSKYIGETEKNLKKIFDEAETSNSILFFDEADALFGKRSEVKDSHDRYANIETAYLLQKMEEHEGVVILASNFRKNMDDAFLRRLHFMIDFPLPDEKSREDIWQKAFPEKAPRAIDIDFAFLAKLKLTGGNIKNIVLSASFLAAENSGTVEMLHLIKATKREYQKIGKMFTEADFGEYYRFCK